MRSLWFRLLAATLYRRLVIVERLLRDEPDAHANSEAISVSLLNTAGLAEYLEFRGHTDAPEILSRLERGEKCFLAREHGVLASACWAAVGSAWIDYLGCEIQLDPDTVYLHGSFTAPAFRNRNIPVVRSAEMVRHFRQEGYTRLIGAIVPENKAGMRPAEKAGYKPIGYIGSLGFGRWSYYFIRVNPSSSAAKILRRPRPQSAS